jgi:5'-nucleotidase
MRILLTNDDGIDAPGLKALYASIASLGEVAVSAPDRQYSAASHSISLNKPFKIKRNAWPEVPFSFAVSSSPADCVRLAVLKLLPFKPDLVISGINHGANYGTLVLYSGTVAAAAEAVILGIPSIAVSVTTHDCKDFSPAAQVARRVAEWVAQKGLPDGVLLNVNVPPLPLESLKGLSLSPQGKFRHVDDLEPHQELEDHFGYVLDSPFHPEPEHPDADVEKVRQGWAAVTPLHLDLTARGQWAHFADWPWGRNLWKG